MSKRKIVVFHSQTGTKETVESSAATWGELKRELSSNVSEKTCILSGSKLELSMDGSQLPAEPFTVFVYPKESKGGMAKRKAVKKARSKKPARKPAGKVRKARVRKAPKAKKAKASKVYVDDIDKLQKEAAKIAREAGIKG